MASASIPNEKLGVSPGKLKLIGLLSVILVVVLYLQYGGAGTEVAPAKSESHPTRKAKRKSELSPQKPADSSETPIKDLGDISSWKEPELATVIRYDPFALPAAFPQPKPTLTASLLSGELAGPDLDQEARDKKLQELSQSLAQLRQQGVQVIITKGDEFVAMIGKHVYHVGDEIGGFKITSIDADGVHVEGAVQ